MTALYVILGVAVLALIVLVILYFRNKKKAAKAAAQEADSGLAPGGDEVAVLIHQAEAKLAAAKLGQSTKVGNLPVFIVMGEPGTTKTSVMLHSGLEPELVAGQVYQGGNVAPTRTANLWFSRRSLFVEAGSPLLGDAGKWNKFVKRLQPKAAVVGKGEQAGRAAVVCFDCENFTKPGSMDIVVNAARTLRARLGEISQAMGINLPVYALFTKTDRLPYFTDYVRNLNNEEATQVLGVTLPMVVRRGEGVYAEEETARLTGQFELLFRALADGRPEFLARETDATKLPPAYEFPREFRKIRPALVQFLVDLCRPSQLTVGPFLRGFYFTGVRPVIINEAAPVAAPAPQQQAAFGTSGAGATGIFAPRAGAPMQPQAAPPPVLATRKVPQWVFLSHLFNDVLLADRAALDASGASTRVSGARRILFIVAASLAFLLTVFFTISFIKNRGLENQVRTAARGIPASESAGSDLASLASLQKLDALRQSLEQLSAWERDGHPFFYGGFLYVGDELYRQARPVYCSRYRQLLLRQTQDYMVAYLRTLAVNQAEYRPAYEALRSYLITTSHPEKSDTQLPPVLMRFWTNDEHRIIDPERRKLAQAQFDFYQKELLVDPPCTNAADGVTVENARAYLKRLGGTQRVYQAMLAAANKKFPRINFNDTFRGSEKYLIDPYWVSGAFTKDGWKFMTGAIGNPGEYVKGEAWVLGDESSAGVDLAKLTQEIKPLYVNDFINEWRKYIQQAKLLRYADLRDASTKLTQLSGNQSPLLELLALCSQHTAVDDPAVTKIFQPVQSVVLPTSTDRYIGGTNQGYMDNLGQLLIAIDAVKDQSPPSDAAAAQTQNVAGQAKAAARKISQGFTVDPQARVDQQVEALLLAPITEVEGLLKGVGAAELNAAGGGLCKQMAPLFKKYPFNPSTTAEKVTLAEFNQFFKLKDGAIWQLADSPLIQKVVTKQGPEYVAKPGAAVPVNPRFLDFLNRCARFAEKAYANGSGDPRFAYQVKVVPSPDLDSVNLTIDGQNAVFPGSGGTAKDFSWPGASAHNVRLTVKMKGGNEHAYPGYDGLWAVFEFVTEADYQTTGRPTVVRRDLGSGNPKRVTQDPITNKNVSVSFEIVADPTVFDKGYFAALGCVATVAK